MNEPQAPEVFGDQYLYWLMDLLGLEERSMTSPALVASNSTGTPTTAPPAAKAGQVSIQQEEA